MHGIPIQSVSLARGARAADDDPPLHLTVESDEGVKNSPLRTIPSRHASESPMGQDPVTASMAEGGVPPSVSVVIPPNAPRFDAAWGTLYIALLATVLATSLMIWLTTSPPRKVPMGDTMYTILRASARLLFADTVIAIGVSAAWVYIIYKWAPLLIYGSILGVPTAAVGLFIYSNVMSYRSEWGGASTQDKVMRASAYGLLAVAAGWCYLVYRGRHVLEQSLGVIRLACSIVNDNKPIILVTFGTVAVFVMVTAIWIAMFARIFLEGHVVGTAWVLDSKAWALGAAYVVMYLWTWGVISGLQRAAVAGTVSQWYFHRHEFPSMLPRMVVQSALQYVLTVQFGTVCLSSLMALLLRSPLLIFPRRFTALVQAAFYHLASASLINITSPLTLTNAIVNTQSLADSARTVAQLRYMDRQAAHQSWAVYSLSKLLLSAARILTALILGFGGWIRSAVYTEGGSLYGYMVGLLAGFIGWFVLGAVEGTLGMTVDAAFVCFALDAAGSGGHSAEADRRFGGTM